MNIKIVCAILVLVCLSTQSFAQCYPDSLNMEKLYQYDAPSQSSTGGVFYNDVWGYVDTAGREYGIIASADSVLIFDVTNESAIYKVEAQPVIVPSVWRDMKTYDQYLYVGTEGSGATADGILVFDLSTLPDSFRQVAQLNSEFTDSHNIYVDSLAGRLYAVGANAAGTGREGFVVYDVAANPANPPLLKIEKLDTLMGEIPANNYYIHDIFVQRDTAYCSHGNLGYGIWDVRNLDSIYKISLLPLPVTGARSYVHSSWNTEDDDYAYIATEIGNRQIWIVDQSDKTNPSLDTTWREPLLDCLGQTASIPHNPYVVGDYLYISHYQDGVAILDITTRRLPNRVGYYDLDTTNNVYSGTTSNWGVYPFLPSGLVIGSDTRNGFFVLKFSPPIVPIELRSFDVNPTTVFDQAQVRWDIASASNVYEFRLERSKDGFDFETITSVLFEQEQDRYEFLDKNLSKGQYYYRLTTIDYDGSYMYSEVRSIKIDEEVSFVLYPTSSTGNFTVELSLESQWGYKVYDTSGKLVGKQSFYGTEAKIQLENLVPGIYYMHLSNGQANLFKPFQIVD